MRNIKGVFVPLVTPLTKEKKLDRNSLRRLLRSLEPKVDGFIPCMSTGEGIHMDGPLWHKVLRSTLEGTSHPVITGIEVPTTKEVIARIDKARALGVDTILALPPFGEDIPQSEIMKHYSAIAETGIDIVVYNKKMMCGTAIHMETLLRICQIPSVIGVKEGSMDWRFTQQLMDQAPDVVVFHAWENMLTKPPAHGSITAISNLEPDLCREAIEKPSEDLQRRIDERVSELDIGSDNGRWYHPIKLELVRRGILETATCLR